MNVLLITSDQQHWYTLGLLNPDIQTPNLDRLARSGMLCRRAYCPNPTCTPTRASIITGLMPSRHGAYSLGTRLPENVPTLGAMLSRTGYHTALIGKAHFQPLRSTGQYPSLEAPPVLQDLDFWRNYTEPFYGFQHIELARNHADEGWAGQHYAIWMEENGFTSWRDCFQPPGGHHAAQEWTWNLPVKFHYNTWIAERTNAAMDACRKESKPFFIWASFPDPHPPYLAPEPWDALYDPEKMNVPRGQPGEHDRNPPHFGLTQQEHPDYSAWEEPDGNAMHGFHSHRIDDARKAKNMAVYYGMVTFMDKYIGQILDHLEETGLAENTLVMFTSDHGHLFGQHDMTAKGAFHYEDLIRVPAMVSCPGTVPAGVETDALLSLVDFTPTILTACGQPVPESLDGLNQWDVWRGVASSARDHVLVENRHQPHTLHLATVVDDRYKVTTYKGRAYGELFDLKNDPGEFNNLWDDPDYQAIKQERISKIPSQALTWDDPPMPRISGA